MEADLASMFYPAPATLAQLAGRIGAFFHTTLSNGYVSRLLHTLAKEGVIAELESNEEIDTAHYLISQLGTLRLEDRIAQDRSSLTYTGGRVFGSN